MTASLRSSAWSALASASVILFTAADVSAQAACGGTTYEAESVYHSIGGTTQGGWNLWSNGYISTQHTFAAGPATIVVTARGTPLGGVWPHMVVSVGGTQVGSAVVGSSSLLTYTFNWNAGAGAREVRVAFDNDNRSDTEDRNLLLDRFKVSSCGSTGPVASPIPYQKNKELTIDDADKKHWVVVPSSYDESHGTPTTLLVWLHGCSGSSDADIKWIGKNRDWITVAPNESTHPNRCWYPVADYLDNLKRAVAAVRSHWNIDPKRVILGGYSSGGDLAYRAAFENPEQFAGVLVANSSPFKDIGISEEAALAKVANRWKFHVAHLAHSGDTTYPLMDSPGKRGVQSAINTLESKGFDVDFTVLAGTHSDSNTSKDINEVLLPVIDHEGWRAP